MLPSTFGQMTGISQCPHENILCGDMDVEYRADDETRYDYPIADSFHEWPGGPKGGTIDISADQPMEEPITYCPTDA